MIEVTIPNHPSKFLIYGLRDPETKIIRYVGKSTSGLKRPKQHLCASHRRTQVHTHRVRWVNSVFARGLVPEIVVLQYYQDPQQLDEMEKQAIAHFRSLGFDLVNCTDGGEGTLGRVQTPEAKRKISEALKGKPGHPHTQEYKDRMRRIRLGKTHSSAVIKKMKEACAKRAKQGQEVVDRQKKSRAALYASGTWFNPSSKPVIELSSGTKYHSVCEAARVLKISRHGIFSVLAGRQRSTGGLSFAYVGET